MIEGLAAVYIFMLAGFTGFEIISKVPAILHTPLMSGSNFVHGIVLVCAMFALGIADSTTEQIIGKLREAEVELAKGRKVGTAYIEPEVLGKTATLNRLMANSGTSC